jgi:hypothetical protein
MIFVGIERVSIPVVSKVHRSRASPCTSSRSLAFMLGENPLLRPCDKGYLNGQLDPKVLHYSVSSMTSTRS